MYYSNIENNKNNICAGYNVEKYGISSNNCTKEMKWKITLNYNSKTLYFCDFCNSRRLYALDNKFDYWQKTEKI